MSERTLEESRMRAFIFLKLQDKNIAENDREMWQEFLSVLDTKDLALAQAKEEIATLKELKASLERTLSEALNEGDGSYRP